MYCLSQIVHSAMSQNHLIAPRCQLIRNQCRDKAVAGLEHGLAHRNFRAVNATLTQKGDFSIVFLDPGLIG